MKVELSLKDRLFIIGSILPKQGGLLEMENTRNIHDNLRITSEEMVEWDIKENESGKGVTWNKEKETPRKFELTSPEIKLLKDGVQRVDKERSVTLEMFPTCQKINKLKS